MTKPAIVYLSITIEQSSEFVHSENNLNVLLYEVTLINSQQAFQDNINYMKAPFQRYKSIMCFGTSKGY